MSDATWKVQVSPKLNDGTLINLRADSAEEAERLLEWATNNAGKIVATTQAFSGVATLAQAGVTGAVVPSTYIGGSAQSHQAPTTSPQGNAPVCSHGQMKLVPGGISKRTQAPYDAFWACQGPRESQCKSQKAA